MTILGHRSRGVFERYNIVTADDLRQAAKKQEVYLENLEPQDHGYKMVTLAVFTKAKDSTRSARSLDLKASSGAEGRN